MSRQTAAPIQIMSFDFKHQSPFFEEENLRPKTGGEAHRSFKVTSPNNFMQLRTRQRVKSGINGRNN